MKIKTHSDLGIDFPVRCDSLPAGDDNDEVVLKTKNLLIDEGDKFSEIGTVTLADIKGSRIQQEVSYGNVKIPAPCYMVNPHKRKRKVAVSDVTTFLFHSNDVLHKCDFTRLANLKVETSLPRFVAGDYSWAMDDVRLFVLTLILIIRFFSHVSPEEADLLKGALADVEKKRLIHDGIKDESMIEKHLDNVKEAIDVPWDEQSPVGQLFETLADSIRDAIKQQYVDVCPTP